MLENHHAATLFFILEDDSCNIFEKMAPEEYNRMRKYIVDNILYTDMTKHFAFMGELKSLPGKDDYDPVVKHKPDLMKAMVHAADIGNPARPFDICKLWAFKILSEFFALVNF